MKLNPCSALPKVQMGEKVSRNLIAYAEGEVSYTINKLSARVGASAPLHAHPHLQVVYVLEGEGVFRVADETAVIKTGDTVQIDANVPHTFDSFSQDTVWLEFFAPVREDFLP